MLWSTPSRKKFSLPRPPTLPFHESPIPLLSLLLSFPPSSLPSLPSLPSFPALSLSPPVKHGVARVRQVRQARLRHREAQRPQPGPSRSAPRPVARIARALPLPSRTRACKHTHEGALAHATTTTPRARFSPRLRPHPRAVLGDLLAMSKAIGTHRNGRGTDGEGKGMEKEPKAEARNGRKGYKRQLIPFYSAMNN